MSEESKDGVRDKTDDIVEKRKFGKLGMKEQTLIGQILSPAEGMEHRQKLPIFLPSTEETLCIAQKN